MKKFLILVTFSLFCFFSFAAEKISHPQLMFTTNDIPQIKKNLEHTECKYAVLEMNSLLSSYFGSPGNPSYLKDGKNKWDQKMLCAIESAAFKYAIEKDEKYIEWAYKTFIEYCNNSVITIYDSYEPYGMLVFTAAEIYDWGYDYLNENQKKNLRSKAYSYLGKTNIRYPISNIDVVTGHQCEGQFLRDAVACAIAFENEDPGFTKNVLNILYKNYAPVRKFVYDSNAPINQGSHYAIMRSIYDLWAYILVTKRGLEDPYDGKISNWENYFLYTVRPDGKEWMRGDTNAAVDNKIQPRRFFTNCFLSSSITKNPYVKYFARKNCVNPKKNKNEAFNYFSYQTNAKGEENLTAVQFLILNDVSVECKSYEEFDKYYVMPYPIGEYFAFSKWEDKRAAGVHSKIGAVWAQNHEHRDAGTFELFCNGILASTSGFYVSGSDFNSVETQNYYHSVLSTNGLLIEPRNVTATNFGDQFKPIENIRPETLESWLKSPGVNRAEIIEFENNLDSKGEGSIFISGNLTKAYKKSKSVIRNMLSIFTGNDENPLIFIVYDEILADKNYDGVFVLHSQTEPYISDSITTVENGGFLQMETLLPQNPSIIKIGGKGKRWFVGNKNYFSSEEDKITNWNEETGWGRIEIRDSVRDGKSSFLNVIQVAPDKTDFDKAKSEEEDDGYRITVDKYSIKLYKTGAKPEIKINTQ